MIAAQNSSFHFYLHELMLVLLLQKNAQDKRILVPSQTEFPSLNVKVHYKTNNYRWLMTYATSLNRIRSIWYKRRYPGHKMADTAGQI